MITTYLVGHEGAADYYDPQRRLAESISNYIDNYVDPTDALRDAETGETWLPVGSDDKQSPAAKITTVEDLAMLRDECRLLAEQNEFAINGHENRISYIVGSGHTYTVAAKQNIELAEDSLVLVQDIIDQFIEENAWQQRQQEIVRRKDRDGECFLRFFVGDTIRVRFIEPREVKTPTEYASDRAHSWGILSDPEDVETVLGYWVDGDLIGAEQIQHRKRGVDFNVKRGLPLFYPVRKNLRRAEKVLRNMSSVAEIQSAIALIRKHQQSTKSAVDSLVQGNAEASIYNATTGKSRYFRQYAPGTIIDAPMGMEYDFPANAIDAGRFVAVLQAELRAVASRLVMPEFMLTSDASNANYSSTMVAEGPAVKMFQRLQWDMIVDDLDIMNRVLDHAVEQGRLEAGLREQVEIDVQPPRIETKNRLEDTQADQILVNSKAMSTHTMALRADLDADAEAEKIEEETEKSMANNPFAGMAPGQGQFGQQAGNQNDQNDQDDDEDA